MTHFKALQESIQTIESLYQKLEQQTLSLTELESLVAHAKTIYDRAIILQYKAFEQKVFSEQEPIKTEEPIATPAVERIPEIPEEVVIPEPQETPSNIEVNDPPLFDFNVFEEIEPTAELKVQEETQVIAPEIFSENLFTSEQIVETEMVEPSPIKNPIGNARFVTIHTKIDPTTMNQIQMSRLQTLLGCFGLNERLQFINELFNGSSEEFAEAVKLLDHAENLEDAIQKASVFAQENNWDVEGETVEDFMMKIKRRYA